MTEFSGVRLFCVAFLVCQTACAPDTPVATMLPVTPAHEQSGRAGQLFFAGQPDAAGLASVRKAGVSIVIDMRAEGERDWNESQAAADAGLSYYNIPISRTGPGFNTDAIAQITALVQANPDNDILLHCASGNRVSAWYAIYLVSQQGLSAEDALIRARATGLENPELEDRIRHYLDNANKN